MLPSDFFRRNVVLSFQEDAIGIRLRDVIGVDNISGARTTRTASRRFPSRGRFWRRSWRACQDEQAKIAGGNTARVYNFDVARLTVPG